MLYLLLSPQKKHGAGGPQGVPTCSEQLCGVREQGEALWCLWRGAGASPSVCFVASAPFPWWQPEPGGRGDIVPSLGWLQEGKAAAWWCPQSRFGVWELTGGCFRLRNGMGHRAEGSFGAGTGWGTGPLEHAVPPDPPHGHSCSATTEGLWGFGVSLPCSTRCVPCTTGILRASVAQSTQKFRRRMGSSVFPLCKTHADG